MDRSASVFPAAFCEKKSLLQDSDLLAPNQTLLAHNYLSSLGAVGSELFSHAIATLHSPAYASENEGALKQDWPRIPLPAT
jgi:hypothetical protein